MPDASQITLNSIVSAARDQVSSELAGEVVILNVKAGVYHGLDATGARIWELLKQPRRVVEIRDTIVAEYDVEPSRCENDVMELLKNLAANGLVDVRDEAAA